MTISESVLSFVGSACGLFIILSLLQMLGCQETRVAVMAVADYDNDRQTWSERFAPIPTNLYAEHDLVALESAAQAAQCPVAPRQEEKIETFLNQAVAAQGDSTGQKTLLVYLSIYAIERSGQVFLLPSNADIDQRTSFHTVTEFADWLGSSVKQTDESVLLVLDVAQLPPDWRLGYQAGIPMQPIQEELARVVEANPHLVVLCSCQNGEQSWSNPETGLSVFVQTVVGGLRGAPSPPSPDGARTSFVDTDNDGVVRVSELYDYCLHAVNEWVIDNRDPEGQHPLLIPAVESDGDRDFVVSTITRWNPDLKSGLETAATDSSDAGAV